MSITIKNHRLADYRIRAVESRDGALSHYAGMCRLSGRSIRLTVRDVDDPRARDDEPRFEQEQRVLMEVEHLNVQRLRDAGLLDEQLGDRLGVGSASPFFVVEEPDAPSLAELLEPRTWLDLGRLVRGMLAALNAVHGAGWAHNDVGPDAIVRGAPDATGGGVLLRDFRSATRLHSRSAGRVGAYLAPEQREAGGLVRPQSDLFGLGATIFEFVSGRRAFDAADPSPTPRPLKPLVDVPPRFFLWLSRLIDRDPDRRFSSAAMAFVEFDSLFDEWQGQPEPTGSRARVAPNTAEYARADSALGASSSGGLPFG